ncbi:MAG TPA: TIGR03118 family protein [Parafilimonas sp.]|nr:TIGR03118 family protein [Parafilimonas sp.]
MKTIFRDGHIPVLLFFALCLLLVSSGCTKMADTRVSDQTVSNAQTAEEDTFRLAGFTQVNLVANRAGYHPLHVDQELHNAWGLSASPGGTFWVSAADGGVSFVYNSLGVQPIPAVKIPSHTKGVRGNPTGQVFNGTPDFIIAKNGKPAVFLFASEDGTISGWNGGSNAIVVGDRSEKGAGYTGLAMANNDGANFLYAANFAQHKIDVFDKDFQFVQGSGFKDPDIPKMYAPFNVRNINNMLYVTYAVVASDGEDSTGAGLGYVDVFWPNGTFSKRIATKGSLNAPWGITPASEKLLKTSALLIGNFGDGHINVYDWDGNFKGQLKSGGQPVAIEGLWAIDNTVANTSERQLYFTAGPADEEDGLFGFLSKF